MITIISGTNRLRSNSIILAEYYRRLLLEKGRESEVLALTDLPPCLMSTDLYGKRSLDFQPLQDRVTASSKFVFIIPEYNGSFPGVLKLFVDACSYPESFYGKKAALVGHSTGRYGNIRGVEHFTGVCNYCGLHVLPLKLHIPHIREEFDGQGGLIHEDTVKFLNQQAEQFLRF